MKKRGQIWVSAVLYIALGMVVLTLILAAGVPLINKMRDRNTIAQTKSVMFNIHDNIQAVANEAKGSTRYLSPIDINVGQIVIDKDDSNRIEWSMQTKNKMMETDTDFTEGELHQLLKERAIVGEYDMYLYLDYNDKNIDIIISPESKLKSPFKGRFSFSIKNQGYECGECPLKVEITVTG